MAGKKQTGETKEMSLKGFKAPQGFQFSTETSKKLMELVAERQEKMLKVERCKNQLTLARKDYEEHHEKIVETIAHEDPSGTLYEALFGDDEDDD